METGIAVETVCEPIHGERYRLRGPSGHLEFSWEQWNKIKELLEIHHDMRHGPRKTLECEGAAVKGRVREDE